MLKILTSKHKLHTIVHYCSFCVSDFEMPEPKESISLIQQGCVECPAQRCENEMARDKAEWPKCFKCLICTTWVRPCLVTVRMSALTLEKEFIQAFTVDHSWPLSHTAQWLYFNCPRLILRGLDKIKCTHVPWSSSQRCRMDKTKSSHHQLWSLS